MASRRPTDRVAAVATAPGRGGIGIVRISGPALGPMLEQLTGKRPVARIATRSRFLDASGGAIDEGIALFFPAPHSYTGEDVIELHGHGNPVVLQALLQRCLALGARLAEPGEFTRRAFLSGKIDLAQAEAVADLIEASTSAAARSAMRSLSGEFSAAVRGLVDGLVGLRIEIEASLDFPEEDLGHSGREETAGLLQRLGAELGALRARARQGALLRRGLRVVIAGQPNVGKSSLLNALAGADRAIVTGVPGTTRDAVQETIQVRGIPIHIVDTAGLRETTDEVERIGISRTWREIGLADVVLLVADVRTGVALEEEEIAARLPQGAARIDVLNKIDLGAVPPGRDVRGGRVTVAVSATSGDGLDLLVQELLRVAGWQGEGEDVFLARERHLRALDQAAENLASAGAHWGQIELCAEELRLAQNTLAEITGEFTADDLLGEIFSRFCIGK